MSTLTNTLTLDGMTTVLEAPGGQSGMVALVGAPGPRGIPGPDGGTALQYPAGESLGGHRMVVLDDAAEAIYADNGTPAHAVKVLGITTGAAAAGDAATIQTGGELTEPSWAWTLNQPVYLGTNGTLTQTPPVAGFSLIVGFPITPTTIYMAIGQPITLV